MQGTLLGSTAWVFSRPCIGLIAPNEGGANLHHVDEEGFIIRELVEKSLVQEAAS